MNLAHHRILRRGMTWSRRACVLARYGPSGLAVVLGTSKAITANAATNLAAWLVLPPSEAERGLPVRVEVMSTYCHAEWGMLFVTDGTHASYFDCPRDISPVRVHEVVVLEGTSALLRDQRTLRVAKVTPTGRQGASKPVPLDLEAVHRGEASAVLMEAEGQVKDAAAVHGRLELKLRLGVTNLSVSLLRWRPKDMILLPGATVRMAGPVCNSYDSSGRFLGASLLIQDREQLVVAKPSGSTAAPIKANSSLAAALNSPLEAARHEYPVKALVTVTYCHPQWGMLLVLDQGVGAYLSIPPTTPQFRPEDVVEIQGVTSAAHGYPEVKVERAQPTNQRGQLTPQAKNVDALASSAASCQWVEIEGRVLGAYGKDGRVGLSLWAGTTNVSVFLLDATVPEARSWMDARVKVNGVVSVQYDAQGKMSGWVILAQESSQVKVLRPAESKLAEIPITSSGGMLVQLALRQLTVRLGDRVEIIGYPAVSDYSPALTNARLPVLGPGTEVAANAVAADDILGQGPESGIAGSHASELVRLRGRLLEDAIFRPGVNLVLQSGGVVFHAILPSDQDFTKAERWAAGSQLAVTGVCQLQGNLGEQPQSFRVLLRHPQHVLVLNQPVWWTSRRLGWVLGGVAIMGGLALLSRFLLSKKNRQLHESEERVRTILNHVQTAIVVMDPETLEILEANPLAPSMMGRSREQAVGQVCHQHLCPAQCSECPVTVLRQAVDSAEQVLLRNLSEPLPMLKTVVPITLGGRRVLLAEDNDIHQELAREMIEAAGCHCKCVNNGRNAAQAAPNGGYDLIFVDCMIPEMDGYQAVQAIRAEEAPRAAAGNHRRIPGIAMTAKVMKGDRERCLAAGIDDSMSKPLEPEVVVKTIQRWQAKAVKETTAVPSQEVLSS